MRSSSYLTVWLGTRSKAYGFGFNPYWHGRMLERVKAQNGTAVYYSYVRTRFFNLSPKSLLKCERRRCAVHGVSRIFQVIAMLARYTKGIKDCDVGSPSLCVHGADFVREHESLILRVSRCTTAKPSRSNCSIGASRGCAYRRVVSLDMPSDIRGLCQPHSGSPWA